MTTKQGIGGGAQSARWVFGSILFIQGFGSALTEAVWQSSFGVAGLLRAAGMPGWTDLVVGAVGAGLLAWALVQHRRRNVGAARG